MDYYSKTRPTKKNPEDQWLQNDITYHQHNFKREIFAGRFKTIWLCRITKNRPNDYKERQRYAEQLQRAISSADAKQF